MAKLRAPPSLKQKLGRHCLRNPMMRRPCLPAFSLSSHENETSATTQKDGEMLAIYETPIAGAIFKVEVKMNC